MKKFVSGDGGYGELQDEERERKSEEGGGVPTTQESALEK